jgi:hypothetical protein
MLHGCGEWEILSFEIGESSIARSVISLAIVLLLPRPKSISTTIQPQTLSRLKFQNVFRKLYRLNRFLVF